MSLAIFCQQWPVEPWLKIFQKIAPEVKVQVWPNIHSPQDVRMALCWKHEYGSLADLPHLQCISSMGAGVDHLLSDPALPAGIPIVRIVDRQLTRSMFEYLITAVGYFQRNFDIFARQQQKIQWQRLVSPVFSETQITILGLGELGGYAARQFHNMGFKVNGWSRTLRHIEGVNCYAGDTGLAQAVANTSILICLLPLTPQTENILNADLFRQCPRGCALINVARGEHLNEKDLMATLDRGHFRGAILDVFCLEPLPASHPFWQHPKIKITPDCSSVTNPNSAAQQIIENYYRLIDGRPLLHQVNRSTGY